MSSSGPRLGGSSVAFLLNDTASIGIYTLSLHDALPILPGSTRRKVGMTSSHHAPYVQGFTHATMAYTEGCETVRWSESLKDRKSTRLNSSHPSTSYAVFCLKKTTARPLSKRSEWVMSLPDVIQWSSTGRIVCCVFT